MAKKQKGSHKLGRSKRNGQASRYKNERIDLQNKLRKLKAYVTQFGWTGRDVADAVTKCEVGLGILHRTSHPWS